MSANRFLTPGEAARLAEIPPHQLRMLGAAGLLFARLRVDVGSKRATLYYHEKYLRDANLSIYPHRIPRTAVFNAYAQERVPLMVDTIRRHYDTIFTSGRPADTDGDRYLNKEETIAATGIKDADTLHVIAHSRQSGHGHPNQWSADRLARIYAWVVPGRPDTVRQVSASLDERALHYASVTGLMTEQVPNIFQPSPPA